MVHKNSGRKKMAIRMYKEDFQTNPRFTGTFSNLGDLSIKSDEPKEGLKYTLKQLDVKQESYAISLNLNVIYVKKRN